MKKKERIRNELRKHFEEFLYVRITRGKKHDFKEISTGYIIDLSQDFVLLKEVDEFRMIGYSIIPIRIIKKLRYNDSDKYADLIYKSEFSNEKLRSKSIELDLSSWHGIFKDLKESKKIIISECEKYKHNFFAIGSIKDLKDGTVYINYFDSLGRFDEKPVEHKFKWVTKVTFDDNYSKVFSKYIKQ